MRTEREAVVQQALIAGGGEMGAFIYSHDWSQTPLGLSETWSHSLKTTLSILLNACSPMFLVWGDGRILLYNDAYFSLLKQGNNHVSLGQSVNDCWAEDWDSMRSDVEQVFTTGQPLRRENQRFPLTMDGNSGGRYYTWSYSAIWDETGQLSGVFATGCRVITEEIGNTRTSGAQQNPLSDQNLQHREQTLQCREEQLRLITNTVPVLMAYIDRDHRYRFVNQTYEDWIEQRATEIIGKHVREVLGETAYEAIRPYMEQALSGQRVSFERQIPYRDGGTRYVRADYVPHINSQGEVEGFIGMVSDISDAYRQATQRKQAEVALRESEDRFRQIADYSPMMIWMSAPDGAGIWFNRQWCAFTGQTLEEALGDGWLTAVHPEDARAIAADCLQAHQRHEPVRLEYRLRRQDGEYRWVFDSAIPRFDDNGVYFGYIGSIIDISDRKLAEEALRHNAERLSVALSAAKLGDWSWDAATDMVTFSQRAAEIFGIPPGPYMTWTQMQNLLHQEDRERARLRVEQAIAQCSDYDIEYRILHPHETERWVAATGRAQYNPSGQVLGMLGVVQDISPFAHLDNPVAKSAAT